MPGHIMADAAVSATPRTFVIPALVLLTQLAFESHQGQIAIILAHTPATYSHSDRMASIGSVEAARKAGSSVAKSQTAKLALLHSQSVR